MLHAGGGTLLGSPRGLERDAAPAAAERIRELVAELAAAHEPRPIPWEHDALRRLPRVALKFGCATAYFSLPPFWWKGQTIGKRLSGLSIVELSGKPLRLMLRFAGTVGR